MIEPIKASVRPRVIVEDDNEVVLLEDFVAELVDENDPPAILLFGAAVAGMTTALQHIAYLFAERAGLTFVDDYLGADTFDQQSAGVIQFCDCSSDRNPRYVKCKLTGWSRDEWIECLLATNRNQCASVMRRVHHDPEMTSLKGNAFIIRLVLDEMAADHQLSDVKSALRQIVDARFADQNQRQAISIAIFHSMIGSGQKNPESEVISDLKVIAELNLTREQQRLQCIPAVRVLLAGDAAFQQLSSPGFQIQKVWPRDLLEVVGQKVSSEPVIQEMLQKWLRTPSRDQSLAASLLHAASIPPKWPQKSSFLPLFISLNLRGAILDGADCSKIQLARGSLEGASLERAQLIEADLRSANGSKACFDDANLNRARMAYFDGSMSSFVRANLTEARGRAINFRGANFFRAELTNARLKQCDFNSTNLIEANFDSTNLQYCCFEHAILDGAFFRHADLDSANFSEMNLTVADFRNASFCSANLFRCNLEGMELPNADFRNVNLEGALLTASVMPHANFANADLSSVRLAEIEWESADLRNADMRGASFHMGSSRSGLVNSTIPTFGSRTGFYTDELNEQDFKAPEEIRKANLRGADLRGARIDNVDFYLVDLRDALYDLSQEKQLIRTGAILAHRAR